MPENEPLEELREASRSLKESWEQMAVSQAQFDSDLADFITALNTYTAAVDAYITKQQGNPGADLTAELATVDAAKAALATEAGKVPPPGP